MIFMSIFNFLEPAATIVAQTIPIFRVLLVGAKRNLSSRGRSHSNSHGSSNSRSGAGSGFGAKQGSYVELGSGPGLKKPDWLANPLRDRVYDAERGPQRYGFRSYA